MSIVSSPVKVNAIRFGNKLIRYLTGRTSAGSKDVATVAIYTSPSVNGWCIRKDRVRKNLCFHLMACGRTVNRKGDMLSTDGRLPLVRGMPYIGVTRGLAGPFRRGRCSVRGQDRTHGHRGTIDEPAASVSRSASEWW